MGGNLLLDDNHETTFIGLAQKFVVHKGYIPVNFTNDIALIIVIITVFLLSYIFKAIYISS